MMDVGRYKNVSIFVFGAIADVVFYVYSPIYYFVVFVSIATLLEIASYYFINGAENKNKLIEDSKWLDSELYLLYLNSAINKLSIFGSLKKQAYANGTSRANNIVGLIYKKMLYGCEFSDALLSVSEDHTTNRYMREILLHIRGNYLRSHSFANAMKEEYDRLTELSLFRTGNNSFGMQKYATASMVASTIVPSLLTFVIIGYSIVAYSYIEIGLFALILLVIIPLVMRILVLKMRDFNEI